MEAPVAAAQRPLQCRAVADITIHALEIRALQPAQIRVRAQQCLHAMAARVEFMHEIRADESRRAGDKTVHVSRNFTGAKVGLFPADGIFKNARSNEP